MLTPELLDRITAALEAGDATPTTELQGLLLAAGGEKCWQRGRLLFRLSTILTAQRPVMASSTTHRFKAAFSGKNFTGFPLVVGSSTKMVTAHNLTDEDVPLLQRNGGAHLLEEIPAGETKAAQASEGGEADSQPTKDEAPANNQPAQDAAFPGLPTGPAYDKLVKDVAAEVLSVLHQGYLTDLEQDGVETVNSGILQTVVEQDGDTTTVKRSSGGPDDLPITAPAADQPKATTPEKIELPQPEPEDLHKLKKDELRERYQTALGKPAPADLLREDLIKAIEAGPEKN